MPTADRPNILLICTDQQRFDALGCYGNPHIATPVLDAFATQGALFENCYPASPMCAPSRASLMTGLYPRNHGLWANGVRLPAHRPMMSRALADAGYDCGLVGKFHLAAAAEGRTEERGDDGFRVFEWAHDPAHTSPQNHYHRWLVDRHPDVWAEYTAGLSHATWDTEKGNKARGALFLDTVDSEAHYSTWVAERTVDFITDPERPDDQPFFAIANFFDPHHPFGAPKEFRDRYDPDALPRPIGSVDELSGKPGPQLGYSESSYGGTAPGFQDYSAEEIQGIIADYYAMVSLVDDRVGRILAALEASGRASDTLVIFTSDHGEMLGDHAMVLKGPMMYECAVKVPLLVRWPGRVPEGVRCPGLVSWLDLTSTVLAAGGMTGALPAAQGADLVPLARGEVDRLRDWALVEYRDSNFPADPPIHTTMLRHGDIKLVLWHGAPSTDRALEGELYDLSADPGELTNLWHDPAHAALRARMVEKLADVLVATEDRSPERTAAW